MCFNIEQFNKEVSKLGEILNDLKCPDCGAYLSFKVILNSEKFKFVIQCGNCSDYLVAYVKVKIEGH